MKRTVSSVLCIAVLITCLALSLSSCAKLGISAVKAKTAPPRCFSV